MGAVPQLEDLPSVDGKRVLLRADFNVPIDDGEITDDLRIRSALPTIEWLQDHGAHVTVCTHLGRPKGKPDSKYSVEPVRKRLAELAPGVDLLENLRFDPGEEANDPAFVQKLIQGFDVYVNDAFGASRTAPTRRSSARRRSSRAPPVVCSPARSTFSSGCARSRAGPSSPCSADRRSRTSSA